MIENTYRQTLELFDRWIGEGVKPLEIAAVLVTVGLSLYRTLLSKEDYEMIVDRISESRHEVKLLQPQDPPLH